MDRVRALKLETVAEGGSQNDDALTETNIGQDYLDALGVCLQLPNATVTTADGSVNISRASDSSLQFQDATSATLKLSQLLTSVLGRPGTHASVADFSHWIDAPADGYASGSFRQASFLGSLPQVITWYASSAATTKLFQSTYSYTGVLVSQKVHVLFSNGVALRTLTETFNYSGSLFSPAVTRVWS